MRLRHIAAAAVGAPSTATVAVYVNNSMPRSDSGSTPIVLSATVSTATKGRAVSASPGALSE
jgi:hypothetical protein